MSYKNISAAVMEQLGIEEDEDPLEVAPAIVSDEILDLKSKLKEKDEIILRLETLIKTLNKRVDHLEEMYYELKSIKR
ncbi:hypothetical protein EZV73_12100 [Acidaminobacter sp. JC074]|uniref:hypothetical protein n=1 Tax=Acidaminobacter sp. JC074 TaxID=2530199 RepID=UPI001F0F5921|nr:hypothetical protein [Acidaminobacter sp. JC074]MCH4888323.1 hypothetical protein [Acidaminobacter sp. JC074]